ncbi:hypothetical protein AAFF_G00061830 [Aldrovandia affinis]|uniref:Uncharacterized protein n=1 Tax=Aldrovandia affinis TaxID=143900 RepID=A0AAD7WDR2_9TELE|nr:hypothetical protein AAFF_G00061830 [Aldrovandia affinis]
MTVHLFGAVSSPSCANFALQRTADDNDDEYDEEVVSTIKQNFYVDDCLKSIATEEQAITLVKELRDVCARGGFNVTKWVSNSRAVLASIPKDDKAKQMKELDLDREKLPVERALGIQWNIENDTFTFQVNVKSQPLTRRGLLSMVSSVLKAKLKLQELCRLKYGWDDAIPRHLSRPLMKWLADLNQLSTFQVPRCMKPEDFGEIKTAQLHHFSDASELGYGTASYIRMTNDKDEMHTALVMGKARVTPLKQVTIPRLELAAATLSVRIDRMLKTEMQIQMEDSVFWTDSQSVFKYINNETKRFQTFVANRISVIRDLSSPSQWRYVSSKQNPAEDASRDMNVEVFLSSRRWLKGPDYLLEPETEWPTTPKEVNYLSSSDAEVRKELSVNSVSVDERKPMTRFIEHF